MENSFNHQNDGQGFGVASLVIGLVAFLLSFIPCIGVVSIFIGTTAVVFGSVSIVKAHANNGSKGLGIAGVSLGSVALIVSLLWVMFLFKLGSKSNIEEKIESFFQWTENNDPFDEPLEDMKSLDDLEKALNELESLSKKIDTVIDGTTIDVDIKVNKSKKEDKKEMKHAKKVEEKMDESEK
jgi:predicted PurR-regulated permease PerM